MTEIKVILICGGRFAIPAMQELIFFKQLAVVAIPRNHPEFVEQATALLAGTGIPIIELEKNSFVKKLSQAIRDYKVDIGLVMTFAYFLPASVYNLPEKGFFNVHPGPLPGYRGADPVFRQIINREEKAGVAIHQLDSGFDTGPVVLQQMIKTGKTDTHGILTSKLAQLAAGMVRVLLKLGAYNLAIPKRLQDETKAIYYKKQSREDICINWQTMDADTIVALVNACNPWNKGAVTQFNHRIVRFLEAERHPGEGACSKHGGTVTSIETNSIIISTFNRQAIKLHIVYVEEGFLTAARLTEIGLATGSRFEG